MSGLIDSLITNNALSRAAIPYEERKPCTIIKDGFDLGPGDLDAQLTGLAKYNLSVIYAHHCIESLRPGVEVLDDSVTICEFKGVR